MGHYERLSYLDNSFLALESRTTHMHVAGLALFEAGSLLDADGGVDIDRIRSFVASKLHLIPRYRQRLARVPVERHPVWVDDEHFHLEYHIRHTSVPKPGSMDQLEALMARLVSQQLDRSKPLWEVYVIEGIEGGRFALASKVHHCMIDGMAGVDLLAVLLNPVPTATIEPAEPYRPRPAPGGAEMVVRETARRAGKALAAVRSARRLAEDARAVVAEGARYARAMSYSLGSGWLTPAPKTPLNGRLSPNRRFAALDLPLDEVKEVKNALGGTVNDVVLATVAGGVRRFLHDARVFPVDDLHFRVMAPVSVRAPGQRSTMGNQVAMWLLNLPVDVADPRERLRRVHDETVKLKETDQALGAASLVRLSAGAPATLVSLASRLAQGARPFNMTVTNIPGPQFPLYMLEARLLAQYPLVPLWHSHGVGIALFSYDGGMMWGFNADYDLMEDLDEFVAAVAEEFASLRDLARAEPAAPTASSTRARPQRRPPLGTKAAATTAKKPAAKKPAAKKPAAKKPAEKKATPKKATPKKAPAKKPAAKKPAATSAAKQPAARKAPAKKPAAKPSGGTTGAGGGS
jgi:WS/DGAT/MGAT family acyltransferase